MKTIPFLLVLFLNQTTSHAQQQSYSKAINEQIIRVENNLSGDMVIEDETYNLQERMKHYNVNGISIAVIDSNKIVWAKGYGFADQIEQRLVTTSTLFEPGSISKSLNAVGLLFLAQQGKLDLYQDINQYLSSWKFPYDTISIGKSITTAQLLSHTSGVSVYGFPGYERESIIPTTTEILDGKYPANTPAVRSLTPPGQGFSYSGGGILVSQQILTDITMQPYEKFMYNNVLKPLSMINSSFSQPPLDYEQNNLATGYDRDGKEVNGKYFIYPEKAAAGLWTTPTDISKYIIEMQLAYTGQSSKVLNKEMTELHLMPYGNESSGMGTFLQERNGEKYFFHDAANKGFRGFYIAGLTNGKGVVLFVNSEDGTILLELLNSIAHVYNWEGFINASQK